MGVNLSYVNNRIWGGRRAKALGTSWEAIIERKCIREQIMHVRIPDGCRQIGKQKLIRVRSPLDYVLIKEGKTVFLDAKTINADTLSYSFLHDSKSTSHQLETMRRISVNKCRAGLLIWFRLSNIISFIDAQLLMVIQPNEGIKYDAGLILGKFEDFKLGPLFQLSFEHDLRGIGDPMLV